MDGVVDEGDGEVNTCPACLRDRYMEENPGGMISMNALIHTCETEKMRMVYGKKMPEEVRKVFTPSKEEKEWREKSYG